MTAAAADKLHALLDASLAAWGIAGGVKREAGGSIIVIAGDAAIRITAAPAGMPVRWMVASAERTRGAASVVGVLRAVRSIIDPAYAPVRLRIAPAPLVPE